MNKLVGINKETGTSYDMTNIVKSITWEETLDAQPGKLEFDYISDVEIDLPNGSIIHFAKDGHYYFSGFVFTRKMDAETISITAYDQTRYLQNKDTYVLDGATSSEVVAKICSDQQLKYEIKHPSGYKLPGTINDNKTYYEMIQNALDSTLANFGKWYIIRDDFGVIRHLDVAQLKTDLVIGDESLAVGFEYETSIDSDSFNQIKLTQENKTTAKRDVYIIKDSENIAKWGRLQYYESVDENMNEAQIKERAEMIMRLKNRETKSLKISCLGDYRLRAGNAVVVSAKKLQAEGLPYNQYMLIYSSSHTFGDDIHTTDVVLELV